MAAHNSEQDERLVLEILRGQRPRLRWASTFVRRHDWDFLAELHPRLAGFGSKLSGGLSDVLERHEEALFSPLLNFERDELKQFIDDFSDANTQLTWVSDVLFGPEGSDPWSKEHPTNRRLMELARLKREMALGPDNQNITDERFAEVFARHRLFLTLLLAEQVVGDLSSKAKKHRGKKSVAKKRASASRHPVITVAKFHKELRTLASMASRARHHLESVMAKGNAAIDAEQHNALVMDLWRLWKRHLAKVGRTPKNRLIIESPSSPIFLGIVGHVIESFNKWRKREEKTADKHKIVRHNVKRRLKRT